MVLWILHCYECGLIQYSVSPHLWSHFHPSLTFLLSVRFACDISLRFRHSLRSNDKRLKCSPRPFSFLLATLYQRLNHLLNFHEIQYKTYEPKMSIRAYFHEIGWDIHTSGRKLIYWSLEHIPDSLTYQMKLGEGDFHVYRWKVTSFVKIGPVTSIVSWGHK